MSKLIADVNIVSRIQMRIFITFFKDFLQSLPPENQPRDSDTDKRKFEGNAFCIPRILLKRIFYPTPNCSSKTFGDLVSAINETRRCFVDAVFSIAM
ncbi:hypothetical protein CDAR_504441 [Caerostris darwini]|uniref:Uncharacterized protein n=1 Tax=Caerostris darwini TaxID=1538125 RepID=A0AAV4S293_9ARAC|nr:hypothetical protein CDAR_504441 [Caerostris darwini]